MPDLADRFRALDDLNVPDVPGRARALGPRPLTEPDGPSRLRRAGIVTVALLVAVVGIGFALRAFPSEVRIGGSSPSSSAHAPRELIALPIHDGPLTGAPLTRFTDIALVRPDGSHVQRLTGFPADLAPDPWVARYGFSSDDSPTFSPDGRTIAFIRRYSEGTDSLCEIRIDGTGFRVVVRDLSGAELTWSPDGSRFAFYSEKDGAIHVMNADGSDEHALVKRAAGSPSQESPSWSADGSEVFFVQGAVFAARVDSGGLRLVLDLQPSADQVAVAPDGKTLAVVQGDGSRPFVWIAGIDGSPIHRLDLGGGNERVGFTVAWSPDGRRLLVSGRRGDLWIVDRDGRDLHRLEGVQDSGPGSWWGPRS